MMKFTILDTVRTNNFNDKDIQSKLQSLWTTNSARIEQAQKSGLVVACVYYEYASNYRGDYSYSVSLCIEDQFHGIFDTTKYSWQEYSVEANNKLGLINTWQKIWADEEQQQLYRVYNFDFEQYLPNGDISIFIAYQ